jgi:hypothetical protein
MPMQDWRRSRWHRKSSRQSQQEADGVTPAGFFLHPPPRHAGEPAVTPIDRHHDSPQTEPAPVTLSGPRQGHRSSGPPVAELPPVLSQHGEIALAEVLVNQPENEHQHRLEPH